MCTPSSRSRIFFCNTTATCGSLTGQVLPWLIPRYLIPVLKRRHPISVDQVLANNADTLGLTLAVRVRFCLDGSHLFVMSLKMIQLRHHGISRKKAQLRMDALRTAPAILPNAKPTPRVFAVVASVTQTSLRRNPVPNEEIYRPNNGDFKGRVTNHYGIGLARDDYFQTTNDDDRTGAIHAIPRHHPIKMLQSTHPLGKKLGYVRKLKFRRFGAKERAVQLQMCRPEA